MSWVFVALVFSALVGRVRGGRIRNLLDVEARAWWLLIVGFGLQLVAGLLPADQRSLAVALLLVSAVPILIMVAMNRNAPGMWIAGIGILMNFLVIAVNRGMPVLPASIEIAGGSADAVLSGRHVPLDGSTHLPFLGDIIPLPGSVVSLGDVFLAIGLGIFVEEQMRRRPRLFRHGVHGEAGSAAER
jgi:hypothetical protein